MKLNVSTDYAIRIILYLAKSERIVSSGKLAEALKISPRYLLRIGAKLRDAGLLITMHGPTGGFMLTRRPNEISLYDIIIEMEDVVKAKPKVYDSNEEQFEILDAAYDHVDTVLGEILKSITIGNLLSQSLDDWHLMPCSLQDRSRQ